MNRLLITCIIQRLKISPQRFLPSAKSCCLKTPPEEHHLFGFLITLVVGPIVIGVFVFLIFDVLLQGLAREVQNFLIDFILLGRQFDMMRVHLPNQYKTSRIIAQEVRKKGDGLYRAGMLTMAAPVSSIFWSLVRRKRSVLMSRFKRSVPWALLQSTQRFQTASWSKGLTRRKRKRAYMSSSLFCTGVPVTAQRRAARRRHTACETCDLGLRIVCASSRTMRSHATCGKGDRPGWTWVRKP